MTRATDTLLSQSVAGCDMKIVYEGKDGEPAEFDPADEAITYNSETDHWEVKMGEKAGQTKVLHIPRERVVEVINLEPDDHFR